PVAERHPADRKRAKQVDLGHLAVMVGPGQAAVARGLLRLVGGVTVHRSVSTGAFESGTDVSHTVARMGNRRHALPCHLARPCRRRPPAPAAWPGLVGSSLNLLLFARSLTSLPHAMNWNNYA